MSDIAKVELGVCEVSIDGVSIGHTKGGVEVTYEPTYSDITVDAYGETIVDKRLIGEKWMAKIPFAEYTIANLRKAMPQSEFAGAGNARITIGAKAGKKASDDAVELLLHPQDKGTREHDIVMHKAYASSSVVINHVNDDVKVVEVTFEALLDESKSDGNYLGLVGDSTA